MTEPAETEEPPPKKRKIGIAMKSALLSVIDKKKISDRVDYKSVAARHGVDDNALRHTYSQWKKGKIDMGDPETLQERHLDAQTQHKSAIGLLQRYQALVMDGFERHLIKAEDAADKGGKFDPKKSPLPAIMREFSSIVSTTERVEAAYERIQKELIQRNFRDNGPKPVNGKDVPSEPAKLDPPSDESLSDHEKALRALEALQPSVEINATVTHQFPQK
jgi:hypothetical protein